MLPGDALLIARPSCASQHTVKHVSIHNGKQNYRCRDCGRQFVQDPPNKVVNQATPDRLDQLVLERWSLAGLARVTGVSELWLQRYERVSRLVRKTLSFPKSLDNHIGAIWYFIHHYNAFLPV